MLDKKINNLTEKVGSKRINQIGLRSNKDKHGNIEQNLKKMKKDMSVELGSDEVSKMSINYLEKVIPDKYLNKTILKQNELQKILESKVKPAEREEFLNIHNKNSMTEVASSLKLDDKKIDKIWQVAKEKNVDPKFLLAILFAEGTGSFDTNSDKREGVWKINPNFDEDAKIAANTIKNYLVNDKDKNPYAADSWQAKCPTADPIEFIRTGACPGEKPFEGYAAGDPEWSKNVKEIYKILGGKLSVSPLYNEQAKYYTNAPYYYD